MDKQKTCPNCENLKREIESLRREFSAYIARTERIMALAERRIKELEKENKRLKQRIAELEDKNDRLRFGRFKSNIKKEEKGGKKPGAPIGHKGISRRRPEKIDEYVDIYPKVCRGCGNGDIKVYSAHEKRILEDIDIRVKRICMNMHYGYCPRCKRSLYAGGEGVLPKILLGQNARAIAVALRYSGLSFGKVRSIFEEIFGIKLSRTTLFEFETEMAERGKQIYELIRHSLCKSPALYIDEEGLRVDGINHWLWCLTNNNFVLYHIDRHRSGDVVKDFLGKDYKGVVISDFYSAYNKLSARAKHAGIVHLLRDIREIEGKKDLGNEDKLFCKELKDTFKKGMDLWKRFRATEIGIDELKQGKDLIAEKLTKIMLYKIEDKELKTIRKRILKHNNELLTFLDMPEIEPTNNKAERALRPSVIFRKICFGNRSLQGVKNHQTLMSIINTAKLYGKKALDVLHTLVFPSPLSACHAQAGQPSTILPLPLPP